MTNKELRQLRRSLDITQLRLAQMIGVTQVTISQIESGIRIGKTRAAAEAALLKLAEQQKVA